MQLFSDRHAVQQVIQRLFAYRRVRISRGAKLVLLPLEDVGIDRSCGHSTFSSQLFYLGDVLQPVGQIPNGVQGDGWTRPGQLVDHACVAEFLREVGRCCGLHEFPESGPGIREAPGRQFNLELIERPTNCAFHILCHKSPVCEIVFPQRTSHRSCQLEGAIGNALQ